MKLNHYPDDNRLETYNRDTDPREKTTSPANSPKWWKNLNASLTNGKKR